MAYTATKKPDGLYEVFKDGQRIATGTVSILSQYGLSSAATSAPAPTPTSAPAPAPTPTPVSTGQTYTVKSGDTLSKIAAQYGVPVSSISGYRSGNPNLIYPGEILTIGKTAAPVAPVAPAPVPVAPVAPATPGIQDQTPEQRAAVEAATGAPIPKTPVYAPGTPTSEITGIDTQKNADQQNYFDTINSGTPGVQTDMNKFYSQVISLLSDKKAPTAPSMVSTYKEQSKLLGVETLEGQLADYDAQLQKAESDWRLTEAEEGGRLVSMGQIKKRTGKIYEDYLKTKGELETSRARVVSQLNMKYNVLNTMITLTGKDYEIAQQEYQNKITNAIALTNLIRGISEDQKDDKQRVIDNANANLTIYYNLLKSGNIKYSDLSPSVQAGITQAELLAGKPIGFAKFISETVKDPVVSNIGSYTDAEGNVFEQIMTTKADGTYSITSVKVGTGAAVKPTKAAIDASISSIITGLEKTKGKDGYYDPDKYVAARKAFQSEYPDANVGDLDKAVTDMFSEEAKVRLRTVYGLTLGGNV